jgi:hypothetical protein
MIALIPIVDATYTYINQGNNYNIFTIPFCHGQAKVKVRQYDNNIIDYNIKGCELKDEMWFCNCNEKDKTDIILETTQTTNNTYYIRLQYYIKPLTTNDIKNGDYVRVINFNDIKVGPAPLIKDVRKINIPYKLIAVIVIFVLLFAIGAIFILYYVYKRIKKDDDDEDEEAKKERYKLLAEKYIENNKV